MSSAHMSWERFAAVFLRSFSLPAIGLALLGGSCSSSSNGKSGAADSGPRDSGVLDSGPADSGLPDAGLFYDSLNGITWLGDGNLAASNRFGISLCSDAGSQPCINASGSMTYQAAEAWIAAMNDAGYFGHSDWQLPTTPLADLDGGCQFVGPSDASFGFNCAAGALGSLYYDVLGLSAPNDALPASEVVSGPFEDFQPYLYWTQTDAGQAGFATFSFNTGFHGANTKPNFLYLIPMVPGKEVDAGGLTVFDPVSGASWLMNANIAASNAFGLPACIRPGSPKLCVSDGGAMNWESANQLVSNMNDGGYLGETTWALPTANPDCATAYVCDAGNDPLGELYYGQLGLEPGTPVVNAPDIAVGPFRRLQPYLYWSCQAASIQEPCLDAGPAPGFEWSFSFGSGFLGTDVLKNELYVTAYFAGH
jgi:hypothetical protein